MAWRYLAFAIDDRIPILRSPGLRRSARELPFMERCTQLRHKWILVLQSIALLIVISFGARINGQNIAKNELPDAPVPGARGIHAVFKGHAAPRGPIRRRWLNLNTAAISLLAAGEALDSWTTYRNLTHPKWICGYSPAFGSSATYISNDGNRYDAHTIQYTLCGPDGSGRLANYAYDVTRTGAFTETGWVTKLHLAGNRDVVKVLALNVGDDVGQLLVARYLRRREGIIGKLAPGINFTRGLIHIDCGIRNLQFARSNSNATTWQFNLPNEATLYPGPRWWGRQ